MHEKHTHAQYVSTEHPHKYTHAHTFSTCFRQGGEAAAVVLLLIISYCYSDSLKHAAVSHS